MSPRAAPDWNLDHTSMGGKGWKPDMVRFYPAPDGRLRRVDISFLTYKGISIGASHWYVTIKPEPNRVWNGECWCDFNDDPEHQTPPHRTYSASIVRKDRAVRWMRQILAAHFPADQWRPNFYEAPGIEHFKLHDDPAEEDAVRSCLCCGVPRCEHEPPELAECDAELRENSPPGPDPDPMLAPPAVRRRIRCYKEQRATKAAKPVVLVDPGGDPITGTVGAEIRVLEDMHPSNVGLVFVAKALIVEAGGRTVHLAQVASQRGVAVLLQPGAVAKYPMGTALTITLSTGDVLVHRSRRRRGRRARCPAG